MPEPRREEIAPVYAEFGSACVQAHSLEDALRLLLLVGREYAKTQIPEEALRYPVHPDGIRSLGSLFQEVLRVEVVSADEQGLIWKGIRVRNWLVHRYWGGAPTKRMLRPEGRRDNVQELKRIGDFLREVTAIVHQMIDRYLAAYGQSIQRYMDQAAMLWESDGTPPGEEQLIH